MSTDFRAGGTEDGELIGGASNQDGSASCRWTEYEDCEAWDTGCGHAFYIENGTPQENDMKFCCYCGKTISS